MFLSDRQDKWIILKIKDTSMLKTSILLLTIIVFQNLSFGGGAGTGGSAGGSGNGGSGGGEKKSMRAPASTEEVSDEQVSWTANCLADLDSSFKPNYHEKDYKIKIDNTIAELIGKTLTGRSSKVLGASDFPECFAYSRDTRNNKLLSFWPQPQKKTSTPSSDERATGAASISK